MEQEPSISKRSDRECSFTISQDGKRWACSRCGYSIDKNRVRGELPPKRDCTVSNIIRSLRIETHDLEQEAAGLGLSVNDVANWGDAVLRWILAGRPTRTDEEVAACLAECHIPCEEYVSQWGGRCKACRCRVNKGQLAVFNKARMATEDCPKGEWPKLEGKETQCTLTSS